MCVAGLLVIVVAGGVAYSQREPIARNIVESQLDAYGLKASYEIESIEPLRQVVRNIRIGDPRRPDFMARRAIVHIRPRFFGVTVTGVELEGARLYGTYDNGKLSFGSLDPLMKGDPDAPFELPDLALRLDDMRALLETEYGDIGFKAEGKGNLRDGFAAKFGAISHELTLSDCRVGKPQVYGKINIAARQPKFEGPLRFESLDCKNPSIAFGAGESQLQFAIDRDLAGAEGKMALLQERLALPGFGAAGARGNATFRFHAGVVSGHAELNGNRVRSGGMFAQQALLNGDYSIAMDFTDMAFDGRVSARGTSSGALDWRAIDRMAAELAQYPVGPLLAKFAKSGLRDQSGLLADANIKLDYGPAGTEARIEAMQLRQPNGTKLASANNLWISLAPEGLKQLGGNFRLGGGALPVVRGNFLPASSDRIELFIDVAPYSAGNANIAIPRMALAINSDGSFAFSGAGRLSGPMPEGRLSNLSGPIRGSWDTRRGLALYDSCTSFAFDAFEVSGLEVGRRSLQLCPTGRAIVDTSRGAMRIAAYMPNVEIDGRLGGSALAVRSDQLSLGYPGGVETRNLDLRIGQGESATHIRAETLELAFGEAISGRYAGAQATIGEVPLLLANGSGNLSYRGGTLALDGSGWDVSDRVEERRFLPLKSDNFVLRLADNQITANGSLYEPETGRNVTDVVIAHDLTAGRGHADLAVRGITFDNALQPEMLTPLTLGVVANVKGSVTGEGRIDWGGEQVTSTGRFRTDSTDLAAAFGPVTGLRGEIVFSDLLGLETAPGQLVRLGEVNPGIPAFDGVLRYRLLPGQRVQVEGGEWPFAGGLLTLEPTMLDLSEEKERRLTFRMEGLHAAEFLTRFDFDNISATGIFDGTLPMIFDQDGGRIEGGRLVAREGGGTLAYVGELTYEDLSPMANYAFDALKSIRYRELTLEMDGAIDGEIITQVRFAGIQQGEGAERNFVTRELAKLPIIFNVTIKAPFLQLVTSARSLYDPEFVRDPRSLGIVGRQLEGADTNTADETPVQTPESEDMP